MLIEENKNTQMASKSFMGISRITSSERWRRISLCSAHTRKQPSTRGTSSRSYTIGKYFDKKRGISLMGGMISIPIHHNHEQNHLYYCPIVIGRFSVLYVELHLAE